MSLHDLPVLDERPTAAEIVFTHAVDDAETELRRYPALLDTALVVLTEASDGSIGILGDRYYFDCPDLRRFLTIDDVHSLWELRDMGLVAGVGITDLGAAVLGRFVGCGMAA